MVDIGLKGEILQHTLFIVIKILTLLLQRFLFLIIDLHHLEVASIDLIAFVEFLPQDLKPILEYLMRLGPQRYIVGIQLVVQSQMQVPDILYEIQNHQTMTSRILGVDELPLG